MRTRCATLWTMPRVTGESLCSTTWCSFLKPRALTVARWRSVPPIGLLISSSLRVRVEVDSVIGGCLRSYRRRRRWCFGGSDRFDTGGGRLCFNSGCLSGRRGGTRCGGRRRGRCNAAAHLDHDLWVAQVGERQQRRLNHVDRVGAAERLGENVLDPGRFDDRAHGTPSDHSGAWRGWFEQDLRGAELLDNLVRDGRAGHRHADQIFARAFSALTYGVWDFVGFPEADANVTRAVADDDDS